MAENVKNEETKKNTKKKATTTTKKNTTTKKKTTSKNANTKKKNTSTKPKKKVTPVKEVKKQEEVKVEEVVEKEPVVEEVKIDPETFDPKETKEEDIDTVEERNEIAEIIKDDNKEEIASIKQEIKEENTTKKDKVIDAGIVVVVLGLFILVLTTYLTSVIELSYQETNILVIVALAVEALGVAIMLVGTFKK